MKNEDKCYLVCYMLVNKWDKFATSMPPAHSDHYVVYDGEYDEALKVLANLNLEAN